MDDLVEAYWQHYELINGDRADRLAAEELFWSWEAVNERIGRADLEAFELLAKLADKAPTDSALGYLGAGPIEDLLWEHSSDPPVIDRLIGCAERSPRVRLMLRGLPQLSGVDPRAIEALRSVEPSPRTQRRRTP